MRQMMTRLAAVGAMSLVLIGGSASAALAGHHHGFSSEEVATSVNQCVMTQHTESGGLSLPEIIPDDLLGGSTSTYNCIDNKVLVLND